MDKKVALEIAIDAVRRRKAEIQQQYRLRLREFDEAVAELEKMRALVVAEINTEENNPNRQGLVIFGEATAAERAEND